MIRFVLLILAVALFGLSLLTVFMSPDWAPWQLGVLAGEFGHWLALGALVVALCACCSRDRTKWPVLATLTASVAACVLLLRPSWQASRIQADLPAKLTAQFGPFDPGRPAFSPRALFGRNPAPVTVRTLSVAPELPLDFYPTERANAPCVIVIHGGGWDGGDRSQLPLFNHWIARKGYAVAAISYRLAPRFQWPSQRDDVLAAITFLKGQAAELGIDATRLILLGRSAGGQIAEAVGYTADDPAIRGVVGLYAPSDLIFGYENAHEDDILKSPHLMRQFLGGTPESARANYESASPLHHVGPNSPPTLLLHGTNDALAWYRHSVRLEARLAQHGVPHALVLMPWATHAFEYHLHGPGGQLTTFALEWFLACATR